MQSHVMSCKGVKMISEATWVHHDLMEGIAGVPEMTRKILYCQSWQIPVEKLVLTSDFQALKTSSLTPAKSSFSLMVATKK